MSELEFKIIPEEQALDYVEQILELRAPFFAEYPYLQDPTDMDFQRSLVTKFLDIEGLILVVALDGNKIVGVSTGAPFTSMDLDREEFRKFFFQTKTKPEDFFYGIWTLTNPEYRRMGINATFGDMLNKILSEDGYKGRLMENIVRPKFDPRAPEGFTASSEFFLKKRGYVKIDVKSRASIWKDVGDDEITTKYFDFYCRWL